MRLLGTVILTLVIVSGSVVIAYQFAPGVDDASSGVYWFVGLCSIPLVVGLTIDYDVRLVESTKLAIKASLLGLPSYAVWPSRARRLQQLA